MSGSPYASALGKFKALGPGFLPRESYAQLLPAKDTPEILKLLEPTAYGPELAQAAATYKGLELLEVAVNRLFVRRNRLVLEGAPFSGKPIIQAFLTRWDIQNIGLILSAKAEGRQLSGSEAFLVSSREIPAGLFAGNLGLDDVRQLLAQPSLEAVVTQLVRYGYGGALLPLLPGYARSHDIFPLLHVLDQEYYARLFAALRYFQGDEWVVRQFVQGEIDGRNALLLLKGRDASLAFDEVQSRFLDGGNLGRSAAAELYTARDVAELVSALEPRFPGLGEGLERYREDRSLVGFESALLRERALRDFRRFRTYPLSLAILFGFLLQAELERLDLRRIGYGKAYGVAPEAIEKLLIVPRL